VKTADLERRIRAMWDRSSEDERYQGAHWYPDARAACQQIATRQGISNFNYIVAGVAAAISPGMRWERNLYWAELLIAAKEEAGKIPTYSYDNVRKALAIIDGERPDQVLRGEKVTAFYRLLRDGGNDSDVCIDGHAYSIAVGWRGPIRNTGAGQKTAVAVSKPELRRVAEAYRRLAHKLGVQPHVLQATTWLTKKRWSQPRLPVFGTREETVR
jgi:hypothetical protein